MAHVGDVHDALDVVALIAQGLFQHVLHDVAAQIADVGKVIDRRAAGVHLDDIGVVGNEQFLFSGCGIIQIHGDSPLNENPPLACKRRAKCTRFHSRPFGG